MDAWRSQSLQPGKGKENVEEGVLCVVTPMPMPMGVKGVGGLTWAEDGNASRWREYDGYVCRSVEKTRDGPCGVLF